MLLLTAQFFPCKSYQFPYNHLMSIFAHGVWYITHCHQNSCCLLSSTPTAPFTLIALIIILAFSHPACLLFAPLTTLTFLTGVRQLEKFVSPLFMLFICCISFLFSWAQIALLFLIRLIIKFASLAFGDFICIWLCFCWPSKNLIVYFMVMMQNYLVFLLMCV